MNLLQRLFGGAPAKSEKRFHTFHVKCLRCGEVIEGRVDLNNDLSVEFGQGGDVYYARKILMGSGKCFQRLEVTFKFTPARVLIDRQVAGGGFV